MALDILNEEFEVLESIYSNELTKISAREINLNVTEEEGPEPFTVRLFVTYTDDYPNVLPDLKIEAIEGHLSPEETTSLLHALNEIGEENLGMALTFTLVSHLKEQLTAVASERAERLREVAAEQERIELEAEEARSRGTPVTTESFKKWKEKFTKETKVAKEREEEVHLKGLSSKERDEYKKIASRLTGRALFERNRNLDTSDLMLQEEGAVGVDFSQYDRQQAVVEEDRAEGIAFSDSD